MAVLRPNSNASFVTERLFGFGAGMLVAALILSDGDPSKSALIGLLGACLVIGSTVASIVLKRRQLARDHDDNLNTLKK